METRSGDMWRSASSDERRDHFVVIGNPGGRRVELFQAALNQLRLPAAECVSCLYCISDREVLRGSVREGTVVRVESPGKDFEVEGALIAAGADAADDDERFDRISRRAAQDLNFERGRILYPRQWYRGYCVTLRLIELQLAECPPPRLPPKWMNSPAEIAL